MEGRYAGQEFAPPEVPTEKDDQPFPWLAMVAPVLLGVSMWLIFDRPAALLFVLMSPMMHMGNFFMNRSKDQRLVKRSIGRFDTRLAALSAQLLTERTLEQQAPTRRIAVDRRSADGVVRARTAQVDPTARALVLPR